MWPDEIGRRIVTMSLVSTSTYTPNQQGPLLFSLRFLGYFIFAVALLVMLGWVMNIHSLTTLSPDFPSMKFNTALAFAISGIGILLGQTARERHGLQISGLILMLLMGTSLIEYLLNINLGIDEFFGQMTTVTIYLGGPPQQRASYLY